LGLFWQDDFTPYKLYRLWNARPAEKVKFQRDSLVVTIIFAEKDWFISGKKYLER
jgi:hypothetical protein